MEYPELAARTGGFTHGAPRVVAVAADGGRVVFLRSTGPRDPVDRLWVYDVARGTERLVADPAEAAAAGGIRTAATDPDARTAVFTLAGRLYRADLTGAGVTAVPTSGPATDPRVDPTGQRISYLTGGSLRVIDAAGDVLLAGEPDPAAGGQPHVSWGRAEPVAARRFGRRRGYWWAPDGRGVLAARVDETRVRRCPGGAGCPYAGGHNAEVTLHVLDLDGGWVDVHWDRETYPYLVSVSWADLDGTTPPPPPPRGPRPDSIPLITVLRRPQQHGLVLAVDPRTGETQVHAELADPRWVEPIPGTPCHLPDGRVLVGGELAHDGYDARCLFADGTLLTPPSLYVRRMVGRIAGAPAILVEATESDPSEQHLFRVGTSVGGAGMNTRRLTTVPGWHRAVVGGDTLVVGSDSLDHPGTQWAVWRRDRQVGALVSYAARPPAASRPALQRVTDRRLPSGVLYPTAHLAGRKLPVLVDMVDGGQGVRATRAAWLARQWWADAGFAVVAVDHRGTPGVAPSYEKVVHRRLADLMLADQTDALAALTDKHPDLDLDRVAVRGRGLGGWLAGLAVLRRPDVFRCAVAESPVADWARYDTAFAERYLGLPDDGTEVYARHSLLVAAAEADGTGPLLLVPDRDDDPHVRGLAEALAAAGHPYQVLPAAAAPEQALRTELGFLRHHLG